MSVEVDDAACRRIASVLVQHAVPVDREDEPPGGISEDRISNLFLLLVGICHQTQSLEGKIEGTYRRGWDYLSQKLLAGARLDVRWLMPKLWADCRAEDVRDLFRDDAGYGETLHDPEGRADLIRDLGREMQHRGWRSADEMYNASGGRIDTGPINLLTLLERFRAYNDPVRKKSFFYLGLMANCGRWVYADVEHLGAPVDYHEVRGHLRTGTIVVRDAELRFRILQGEPVRETEDVEIRGAVHAAIKKITDYIGMSNPMTLHYLFWNLFRNVCRREKPYCHTCPDDCGLPQRYMYLLRLAGEKSRCPFDEVCPSADLAERFREHVFVTDWY